MNEKSTLTFRLDPRKQQSHNPDITPEEKERRKKAAKFAIASVGLEGFRVPATEIAHMNRFISGEISFQEYMEGPFR